MTCLTDARIQAVADGEGTRDESAHVTACAGCEGRVRERARLTGMLEDVVGRAAPVPGALGRRVENSLARGDGATRLRSVPPRRFGTRAWSGVALAAATLAFVLFMPSFTTDRGAATAAGILAESAHRLAAPGGVSGVEVLAYDLVVEGLADVGPQHPAGRYHIRKVIDHDMPGRYRFATYAPDGTLLSAIAQDPARGVRTIVINPEGQRYRFEFTLLPGAAIALPEIEQLHMQASIGLMQASDNQLLDVVETPAGTRYRVEVPEVRAPSGSPLWDLTHARVMVDAADYRVTEFAAKGTFLRQPYSISYSLKAREITDGRPELFDLPDEPGEIVVRGEGTIAPPRDAFLLALKELAKAKQAGR